MKADVEAEKEEEMMVKRTKSVAIAQQSRSKVEVFKDKLALAKSMHQVAK